MCCIHCRRGPNKSPRDASATSVVAVGVAAAPAPGPAPVSGAAATLQCCSAAVWPIAGGPGSPTPTRCRTLRTFLSFVLVGFVCFELFNLLLLLLTHAISKRRFQVA